MPFKDPEKQKISAREYQRRWRAANPDLEREKKARWKATHPNYDRDLHMKRKFGISLSEWVSIFAAQDWRCLICEIAASAATRDGSSIRGWATDHDHSDGRVRGILCNRCNRVLGMLGDTAEAVATLMPRFLKYFEK